jgi:hypothetical protein
MREWPRDPVTGRVILGAAAGRTTMEESVRRADARLAALRSLRSSLADLLVTQLDDLAARAPTEIVAYRLAGSLTRLQDALKRAYDGAA